MIDSEFCERCNRPYAIKGAVYCDSCLKDMGFMGRFIEIPPQIKFLCESIVSNKRVLFLHSRKYGKIYALKLVKEYYENKKKKL